MITAIRWYGSKVGLIPWLTKNMPPHNAYVEVFGGSGVLLLNKEPSNIEVYNDLDSGLYTLFKVLRNPEQSRELKRLLELTPYSRQEYYTCLQNQAIETDPVERARMFMTICCMSFSGTYGGGWSYSVKQDTPQRFNNQIEKISAICKRLKTVQIDNRPFDRLIPGYDDPTTLFYCDPPYLPETRQIGVKYTHEMTIEQHEQLLDQLQGIKGMVMLSGYKSDLYDTKLQGWECLTMTTKIHSKKSDGESKENRVECLWFNPRASQAKQRSLFDWNPEPELIPVPEDLEIEDLHAGTQ
jgi:DNA adenine methylase